MSLPLSSSSHATPERVSPSAETKRSNSPQPLLNNSHMNSNMVGHAQHPIPPQSSPPLSGYRASVTGVKTMLTPTQMQMLQQQQQQQGNLAGMHKMPMAKMKMMVGKIPISPHQPMPFKLPPSATASLLSSSSSVGVPNNKMMMVPPPLPQTLSSSQLSSSATLLASSQLPRPAPSMSARSTSPTPSAKMALTPNSYYPPGTFNKSMMHSPQAMPGAKVKMMMNATNMNMNMNMSMNKNKMPMNAPVPPHSMSLISSTLSEAGSLTSEREGVPSLHPVKIPVPMYNLNNNNKKMMMMPTPMPIPSSSITSTEQHLSQQHDEHTSHKKTHLDINKKENNSSNSNGPTKPTPLSSEIKSMTYNATNNNTKANEQTIQSLSTSSTLPSPPLATSASQQKSAESLPSEYVMHNAMQDVLNAMNTNDDDHLLHLNNGKLTDNRNSSGAAGEGGFGEVGSSKENFVLSGLDSAGQSKEDVIVVPAQPSLTDNVVDAGIDANMQSVKQKTKIFVETENAPSARGKKTRFSHLVFGGSSDEDSSDEDKRDIVQTQTSEKKSDIKLSNADMDSNDAANRVKEEKDQATLATQNNNAPRATSEATSMPPHATQHNTEKTNNDESILDILLENERGKPHDDIKQSVPSYEHNLLGINANDAPHSVNNDDDNNNKSMSRSDTLDDRHDNYSHTQVQRDRADSNEFPQVSALTSVSSPALHDLTLTSSPAPPAALEVAPITFSSFLPIDGQEQDKEQEKEQYKKENVEANTPITARAKPKAKAAMTNTKGRTNFAKNDKTKDTMPTPWITSTAKATTSQSKSSARAAQAVSKIESAKKRTPTRNTHRESTQIPNKVDKINAQGEVDNKESLQTNVEERQEQSSDVEHDHMTPDKQSKETKEQVSANDDNDRESNVSRESEEKRFDSVDGSILDDSDDVESYVDSYSYNTENRKLAREMYRFYHTLKAQEARREGRWTGLEGREGGGRRDESRQDYRLAERTSPRRIRHLRRWSSPFANSLDANDREQEQHHQHHSFLHGVRMSTPAAIPPSTLGKNNNNVSCRNNKNRKSVLAQQHSERRINTPVTGRSARPCSVDRITGIQEQHPLPSSSSPFFTVSYSSPRRVEPARSPWRYNSKFTHDLSSRPLSPWRRPLGIIVHSSIPPNKTVARAITISSRKPIRSHSMSDMSSVSSTLSSSRLLSEHGTKRQNKSSLLEQEESWQKSNIHHKENRNKRLNTTETGKDDHVMRQRARSVDDNEWNTTENKNSSNSKTHVIHSNNAQEVSHPYCVVKPFPPHTHVPHTHRESYSTNNFMENEKETMQDKVYISPTCTRLQERLPVHNGGKIKNQIESKDNSHYSFDKDSHVRKMDSANDYDLCDESEVISLNSDVHSIASDRRVNKNDSNNYKSIKGETGNKNNKRKQKNSLQTQELEEQHKNEKHNNNSITSKAKSGGTTNEQVLARKALGKPSSFIGTRVLSQNDNKEWLPSYRSKSARVMSRSVESKERTQSVLPCHTLRKDDTPVNVQTEPGERKITSASCKAWVDDILANVREKIGKERATLPSSSSSVTRNNNINNSNSLERGENANNKETSMTRSMNREREPTIPLIDLRYEFKPKINDSNDPFAINENENSNNYNNNTNTSSRRRLREKRNTSKGNTTRSPISYEHPTRSSSQQYHERNSPFHEPHSRSTSTHSLISTTSETAALHNAHQSHSRSHSEIHHHHGELNNKGRPHSASPLKTIVIDAPEQLPLSFYSTIKVKNPQMPSAWARAPPREKYSVLPGTAAARRVISARGINKLAPNDDDNIHCVNGTNGYTEELKEHNNNNIYNTLLSPSLLSPPIAHANERNDISTRNDSINNVERQLISPTRDGNDIGTNYYNGMTTQVQTALQSAASPLIPPPSPNHFLVEEVHLDEHHKPYIVIKQIPKGQAAQAQREASARLAMPRPVYVKLNNDNINNDDRSTSNIKSVHEKMRESWKS